MKLSNLLIVLTTASTAASSPDAAAIANTSEHLHPTAMSPLQIHHLAGAQRVLHDALDQATAVRWDELPRQARDQIVRYVREHPWQTALHATTVVVLLAPPGVAAAPLVWVGNQAGFGALGPQAGSFATSIQPWVSPLIKGSGFSTFQSAAMSATGYGAVRLAAVAKGGWVVASGFAGLKGFVGDEEKGSGESERKESEGAEEGEASEEQVKSKL